MDDAHANKPRVKNMKLAVDLAHHLSIDEETLKLWRELKPELQRNVSHRKSIILFHHLAEGFLHRLPLLHQFGDFFGMR